MKTIKINLELCYGSCCGGVYKNEIIEVEVTDEQWDALAEFDEEEISNEDVEAAIEDGGKELEELHSRASDAFYYMVEHYWLFEGNNECERESLEETITDDISNGLFVPDVAPEDFMEKLHNGGIDTTDLCYNEERFIETAENIARLYQEYLLMRYREWVYEHDHEFIAPRVGCALDVCHDNEVCYTIQMA